MQCVTEDTHVSIVRSLNNELISTSAKVSRNNAGWISTARITIHRTNQTAPALDDFTHALSHSNTHGESHD